MDYEIIVVDNKNSAKRERLIAQVFPEIRYIGSKNKGYGAGNNLGARHAKGDYLLILNPDTELKKSSIDSLADHLDKNYDVAVVAPNFYHPDGKLFKKSGSRGLTPLSAVFSLSILSRFFPNNPILRHYFAYDIDKDRKRELEAVPGSAFMIRKEVFDRVKGFDENFFLYFEEHDLGIRLRKAGYKIVILPEAKVVHKWKSSKRSKRLQKHFRQSRFYYFKKHFGLVKALATEFLLRMDKFDLSFLLVLLLAFTLRFYKIDEFHSFFAEIGDNLVDIKNFYTARQIPLTGPPTSHPWLDFGPLFYWIFGPVLVLSNFNPVSHAYFTSAVSVLVVIFNYIFTSRLTNKRLGLLSSMFVSTSPFFLNFDGRFFSLVLLLVYPYIFMVHNFLKNKSKDLAWAGVFMGLMINFHLTPILLIPPSIILAFKYRRALFKKALTSYFLWIATMNTPLLLHDLGNNFSMLSKFIVWIPYRVAGFLSLYPTQSAHKLSIKNNLLSLYRFIKGSLDGHDQLLAYVVFVLFVVAAVKLLIDLAGKRYKNKIFWTMIASFFGVSYLGIFLHGNPPSHYYMPIAFIPIVMVSRLLLEGVKKHSMITAFIVALILISNLYGQISNKYSYDNRRVGRNGAVPYNLKLAASKSVVKDSAGEPFKLNRVGNLDVHEGDFAQDYQYLMWWMGNEPVIVGDHLIDTTEPVYTYTILENPQKEFLGDVVFDQGGLVIIRTETR